MKNSVVTKLYGFGSNGAGQLGVGHQDDLTHPQICRFASFGGELQSHSAIVVHESLKGDSIKKLVAGGNHTLVLTESGRVYASGNNIDGRCGVSPKHERITDFTNVSWTTGKNITDIAATWEASFLVENECVIWVCGSGSKGELASGERMLLSLEPLQIFNTATLGELDSKIIEISGSMSHVVVLLSGGDVYGWGSSRKGQLGLTLREEKMVWKPKKLQLPFAVTGIALGRDFTYFWNTGREAILFGTLNASEESTRIQAGYKNPQCFAGWTTLYIMEDGILQSAGEGRRGQLPPNSLPRLKNLSTGSEHCIAITGDKEVVTWGWGEHGNCGVPIDERGNVKDRFNLIRLDAEQHKIAGTGAGCASSFVWTIDQESK